MDVNKKKILKVVLLVILIIIILLLGLLFLRGKSFSKYKKNINTSGTTEIAKPVFEVSGSQNILIDGIQDTVYDFSVRNYNDSGISEVALNYYIQIENNSDADLTFQLTKNGKLVNLTKNKTSLISLSGLERKSDDYQLTIKYTNNTAITNDIVGSVQVKVEAVQAEIE